MPWLFVLLITVLVNFSSSLQAQESTTQIRGPRGSDAVTPSQIRGPRATDTVAPAEQIGPLSPADTLWRVAERVKPAGNISLYQVMYALYLKNPDAFLEDNLNHLKPGAILMVPSLQEIQQVDVGIARQKAEQDDKIWAQRQKAAVPKPVATASNSGAAASTTPPQWQAELKRLDEQQRQQLDGLRSQFADSMQLVETMAQENLQLKTSLTKLQQELELLKVQLGEDSDIQQQIELLVQQQAQLLQAKADEDAAAKLAAEQSFNWQSLLQNPLSWILAACIPALLVLFSVLLWVKKRGQKTEEVINAARTEPLADPTYHSPLPPLEENDELDESLFEIDDALLEDAFVDDTILADSSADSDLLQFDDALTFEDDSLLPAADSKAEQPAKQDTPFDTDNILSDSDLSALFAAADDDDAIVELADNDHSQNDILNEADIRPEASTDTLADEEVFDEFDIDDLIEEVALDEDDDELAELTGQEQDMLAALAALARQAPAPVVPEDETDAASIETEPDITLDDTLLTEPEQSFDSSELEEFAESLVAESEAAQPDIIPEYELTEDEALLNAELNELLDQVDALDDVASEEAAIHTVTPQDIGLEQLPAEPDSEPADEPDTTAIEAALDTVALDTVAIDTSPDEPDDALIDDAEVLKAENTTLQNLDLTALDDISVSRPTEAALSVENPSKILEQYPELELADDVLADEFDSAFELSDTSEASGGEAVDIELDPMPEAQFDTLMTELEAMADNLELTDATADDEVDFNFTDATDTVAAPVAEDFDFADDDFVEIDKLLASADQQELDPERFNKLNVDVGLEEFADIIGEHEQRDVDREDNGYAAKLDLVRAYIEIDDKESATMLLDDILSSDAPQNVKTEAAKLKQTE